MSAVCTHSTENAHVTAVTADATTATAAADMLVPAWPWVLACDNGVNA